MDLIKFEKKPVARQFQVEGEYLGIFEGRKRGVCLQAGLSNFHFGPERGCVVSTSRSTLAPNLAVSCLHALRLVFDTAALHQNENCWAGLDAKAQSVMMPSTSNQFVSTARNPWGTVSSKLASVAGYSSLRYQLRNRPVREEDKGRNGTFSGYPGNHNYAIRNGQLVPCFQLFERFQKVAALLSPEMDSFLDVGCCRGFYVLQCALRPGCRLAVGVDVYEPFVSDAQRAMRCLRLENCGWHVATLDALALDPAAFGGPFHTVLNIGTYHYLYWGSNLCSTAFFDHREILRRFASLCTDRFIISARFEVDRLPSFVRATARFHEKQNDYTTRSFLNAAAEFFEIRHHGFLGTYPLLLLLKR